MRGIGAIKGPYNSILKWFHQNDGVTRAWSVFALLGRKHLVVHFPDTKVQEFANGEEAQTHKKTKVPSEASCKETEMYELQTIGHFHDGVICYNYQNSFFFFPFQIQIL